MAGLCPVPGPGFSFSTLCPLVGLMGTLGLMDTVGLTDTVGLI